MGAKRKPPPSLLDLRVRAAVDNLRRLPGSVDGVDTPLLRRILPHCTLAQLTRIESRTVTDLTPVTDVLWKAFYRRQFGDENTDNAVRRMQQSGVIFKWKDLFRAKTEQQKKVEDNMVAALTGKCRARNSERRSKRTVMLCTKVPPSTSSCSKRSYSSLMSSGSRGYKHPMLKKARMEVDSLARMQAAAIRRPTSHGGQPTRTTTTIRRPNSTTTLTKPTAVNRTNQSSRSRF